MPLRFHTVTSEQICAKLSSYKLKASRHSIIAARNQACYYYKGEMIPYSTITLKTSAMLHACDVVPPGS